jgi:NADP-dependent 3-hydroxy acid dehydrogenase YdfG
MITGVSRGIGRHGMTCAFPTTVANTNIIRARKLETLKDTEDMIKKINSKIEAFPIALEVTNEESVEHAFKAAGEKYGRLQVRLVPDNSRDRHSEQQCWHSRHRRQCGITLLPAADQTSR